MSLIAFLVSLALVGLVIGALGRLALPGPDPMSIWMTMAIGIASSWIAGAVVSIIAGAPRGAGIAVSAAVATFIVYLIRRSRGGSLTEPGRRHR